MKKRPRKSDEAGAPSEAKGAEPTDLQESDLAGVAGIIGSMRAEKLHVVESAWTKVEQGQPRIHRKGVPPSGAREGQTYRDVEVGVEIEGRPPPRRE